MRKIKFLIAIFLMPWMVLAQENPEETQEVVDKPQRPAFESSILIDNATSIVFNKGTLEVQMGHRFGEFGNTNDLGGLWGAANIRIGAAYSLFDWVSLGFGTTKNKRLQDFNWKFRLFQQTRSDKMPVNITYFGNFVIDARNVGQGLFYEVSDRYSFFHQVIISRRFNSKFSFQVAPSLSHYNRVPEQIRNDMLAIAFGTRYKISSGTAIIAEYSQPLTEFEANNPEPGLSLGLEFATSSHTFQVFVTNYWGIIPQENYVFNQKGTGLGGTSGGYLLGFYISRNYNF